MAKDKEMALAQIDFARFELAENGRAFESSLKSRGPRSKSIPVVILTTSAAEEDICHSYALHANCYITKPMDLDGFLHIVKCIDTFGLLWSNYRVNG